MGRFTLIFAAVVLAAGWCAPILNAAPIYHLTDIGTLGGANSFADDINAAGDIVGDSQTLADPTHSHGFLYHNGPLTDLGSAFGGGTFPSSINNSRQIVGVGETSAFSQHAFLWSNGVYTDLRPLGISSAYKINNVETIVGQTIGLHAFRYVAGNITDLGTLGGSQSIAFGINDAGQIAGEARTGAVDVFGTPVTHAFVYSNGLMTDLGSLGGTYAAASDVSPDGSVIVGRAWLDFYQPFGSNRFHAFMYRNGGLTDLGTFGGPTSGATGGINASNEFVGFADVSSGTPHAFLCTNNQMLDLNTLVDNSAMGWTLSVATGINDSGWITGYGFTSGGNTHAFLLTPLPEPAALGFTGLLTIFAGRRQPVVNKRAT